MASPLDLIRRCEPVFAADQQESRCWDFTFTYPAEDFEIRNHAGVTIATGNFYAEVRAHRDRGEVYWDQSWCEILGWYADEALTTRIDGRGTCVVSRPIVDQLNAKSIMDKIEARADELAMEW